MCGQVNSFLKWSIDAIADSSSDHFNASPKDYRKIVIL
jgi:hypothetical protein